MDEKCIFSSKLFFSIHMIFFNFDNKIVFLLASWFIEKKTLKTN